MTKISTCTTKKAALFTVFRWTEEVKAIKPERGEGHTTSAVTGASLFSLPPAQCSSMVCPPVRSPEHQEQKRKTRMTSLFHTLSDSSLLLLLLPPTEAGRGTKQQRAKRILPHKAYKWKPRVRSIFSNLPYCSLFDFVTVWYNCFYGVGIIFMNGQCAFSVKTQKLN